MSTYVVHCLRALIRAAGAAARTNRQRSRVVLEAKEDVVKVASAAFAGSTEGRAASSGSAVWILAADGLGPETRESWAFGRLLR